MSVLKNYEDFIKNNQSTNEKADSSAFMAKYSSSEFRSMVSDSILEKDEFLKEDKINKMHSSYELEMLYESKSHWGETPGSIHYLDFGDHIFLVKNSEGFLLEKKTFKFVKNGDLQNLPVLEEWSWRDFVPDFIESGIDKIADTLSGGAKKVMSWLTNAKKALGEFIHHNHKAISLILSILGAVFGIIGIAVPGFSVAGGICMLLNGSMHISHGWSEFKKGKEHLTDINLQSGKTLASGIMLGLPALLSGGLMICLGANDIWHGATTAMTPAGAAHAVHSEVTKKGAQALLEKTVTSIGHGIEASVERVVEYVTENIVPNAIKFAGDTLLPEAAKAIAAGSIGVVSIYLQKALEGLIGWIYTAILGAAGAVVSAIEGISKVPAMLSKMISEFSAGAEGFIQNIISSGLNSLIKPMTDCIAGFIEKYVTPGIDSVKQFITMQQFAAVALLDMESKEPETAAEIEKIQIQSAPKSTEKIIPDAEPVQVSDEDKSKMKKIAEEGAEEKGEDNEKEVKETEEVKDSYNTKKYRYLKDFKKFDLGI